jgi:hypothetical protein
VAADLHAVAGVALPVGGVDDPDGQPQDPALDPLEGGEVEVVGQDRAVWLDWLVWLVWLVCVVRGAAHGQGCYVSAPGGTVGA